MTQEKINAINGINKFMFYVWNYRAVDSGLKSELKDGTVQCHYVPEVIMKAKWNCSVYHMLEKFINFQSDYSSEKAFMKFYAELSSDNRIAMLSWILENYKGTRNIID